MAGDAPLHMEYFWSKGPKFRSETVLGGRPITTIVNAERYLIIDELEGAGVSIRRNDRALAADATRDRPFAGEGTQLLEAGAEMVRTEKFGGVECDLYRLTNRQGRREVCLSQDESKLPLRTSFWSRASGDTVETRYVNWARDFEIADSFFEPDPRISFQQFEYEDYVKRAAKERIGPAPALYGDLLHGR